MFIFCGCFFLIELFSKLRVFCFVHYSKVINSPLFVILRVVYNFIFSVFLLSCINVCYYDYILRFLLALHIYTQLITYSFLKYII